MKNRPVRIVCFDLGGVVVRICRTWQEACERAGLPVRDLERFRMPDLAGQRRELSDAYQMGRIECDAYWQHIAAACAGLYTPDEVRRVHEAWIIEEYPGMTVLMDQLRDAESIRTACLSNTNHSHWTSLLRPGARDGAMSPAIFAIELPFVSHELGLVKPDEAIYRTVQEQLDVEPGEILFFDDLEENVLAARRCGWLAEQIDHAGAPAQQIARHLSDYGVKHGAGIPAH